MSLRFGATEDGAIVFEDDVLRTFDHFRQRRLWQREAGGQLFARFDGPLTVIAEATTPTRIDRRWRSAFEPNRQKEQRQIDERFVKGLHFVGDWHTHPEDRPTPSRTDLHSVQECLRQSKHQLKALVLVIVGRASQPNSVWVGLVSIHGIRRLHLRE